MFKLEIYLNNCKDCPYLQLSNLAIFNCSLTKEIVYVVNLETDNDNDNIEKALTWKNGQPPFCPAKEVK